MDGQTLKVVPRFLTEYRATVSSTSSGLAVIDEPTLDRPDTSPRTVFPIGTVLEGKYELRTVLGSGGMGQVYEARDLDLNRIVAVKAAWRHVPAEALQREAQVLAAFRHPGLVAVHAFGRQGDVQFFVMERLQGTPLSQRLVHDGLGRPLPVDEAVDVIEAICDTLQVVHGAGLAHADIKPANVMLAPGNRVVLLDFGIARIEQLRRREDLVSGSPHFLAPEAITLSVRPGEAHLVDLYAVGVTAFILLTGQPPFDDPNPVELMKLHLQAPVPSVRALRPEVPAALDALVQRLMAKDPDERPERVELVLAELRRLVLAGPLPR